MTEHTEAALVLADTLVALGLELASAGGPSAVSLREVQRRAGVSHNAAYRHYDGRPAFLRAVASRASEVMAAHLEQAVSDVPRAGTRKATACRRFAAWAQAYVDFALAEPGLFATAFTAPSAAGGGELANDPQTPGTDAAYDVFRRRVNELVRSEALSREHQRKFGLTAWSAIHGFATITAHGPLTGYDRGERQKAIHDVITTLLSAADPG